MEKPKTVKHLKAEHSKETVRRYGEELLQLSDKLLSDDLEAIFGLMLPMLEKEEDDVATMKTFIANVCEKGQLKVDERRRMMFRLNELEADLAIGKIAVLDLLALFRQGRLSREQKG